MKELTWEEIKAEKIGKIFYDKFDEGIRFIVMRGPCSLCAYIGIPMDHPLAGFGYDDIPIRCHGGLTFSNSGDGAMRPKGFWWYGWDYGHCEDWAFYFEEPLTRMGNKKWLVKDVIEDSWSTIYDMKSLLKLAEKLVENIKNNAVKNK